MDKDVGGLWSGTCICLNSGETLVEGDIGNYPTEKAAKIGVFVGALGLCLNCMLFKKCWDGVILSLLENEVKTPEHMALNMSVGDNSMVLGNGDIIEV